jgi:hypothetical protein
VRLSLCAVATTKFHRLGDLLSMKVYLAQDSGGWEVPEMHGAGMCPASGERLMVEGMPWSGSELSRQHVRL